MGRDNIDVTFVLQGGRAGHRLKNISSAILFASLLKGNVVYHESWIHESTSIIPEESLLTTMEKVKDDSFYDHVFVLSKKKVRGMDIDEVIRHLKKAQRLSEKNKKVLLKLKWASRIHLHQAKLWEKEGLIEEGHSGRCIETLRNLQNFSHDSETSTNTFAIHARRGDVASQMKQKGYTISYYKRLIHKINVACCDFGFCPEIKIYSENKNSRDLDRLKSMKNTQIIRGDASNMRLHFDEMRRSEFLFLSWSSFCLWASMISTNNILVDCSTPIIKDYNTETKLFENHHFFTFKNLKHQITNLLKERHD